MRRAAAGRAANCACARLAARAGCRRRQPPPPQELRCAPAPAPAPAPPPPLARPPAGVEDNGSLTRVAAFPIGIDPERFTEALEMPEVKANIAQLLNRRGGL